MSNIEALTKECEGYISSKSFQKAHAVLDKLLSTYPDVKFYLIKAKIYADTNDLTNAIKVLAKSLNKYPDNTLLQKILADCYYKNHDYVKAIDVYLKLVHQGYKKCSFELAYCYFSTNQTVLAFKYANAGYKLTKNAKLLRLMGQILLMHKKFSFAVKLIEQFNEPDDLCNLGTIYWQMGKPAKAIDSFLACLCLNAKHEWAKHNLALLYFQAKEFPKAISYYTDMQKLDNNAKFNLALCYSAIGDFALALKQLKNMHHKEAKLQKSIIYLRQNNLIKAKEQVQQLNLTDLPFELQYLTNVVPTHTPISHIKNLYANLSYHYDKLSFYHKFYQEVFKFLPAIENSIDVGCGTGLLGKYIPLEIGVDVSKHMIKYAKAKQYKKLIVMDLLQLATLKQQFKCVYCLHVLQHFNDLFAPLESLTKVLHKSGQVIFSVQTFAGEKFLPDSTYAHTKEAVEKCLQQLNLDFCAKILGKNTIYTAWYK